MSEVIGVSVREDHLDVVVVRRRFRAVRLLHAFSLSTTEEPGPALRAKLGELGVRTRRVHVGLPRRRVVARVIELPRVAGTDLRRMVGFELERHLPFAAADAIFDYHVLDRTPERPVRVLLVAVERRVIERLEQLLRDAGLVPRLVDVMIHSLALFQVQGAASEKDAAHVVLHLDDADAEVAVVRHDSPILSRVFPLPPGAAERGKTLADELRRTLAGLSPGDREALADIRVMSATVPADPDWTDLPIDTSVALPAGVVCSPEDMTFLPALAMALRKPGRRGLQTNLMPEALRPRPFPLPIAVTATLAAVTLLLALAIPAMTAIKQERRLKRLDRTVARLAPDVREVEQLVGALEKARREVETLRGFERQQIPALAVLRELTEVLPPDVWLTTLSMDRNGLELTGFAGAASQLIPLLEASKTLERVEFTSPVTKVRDREQFRLKAGWERRSAEAEPARAPAQPAPPVQPPQPAGTR